MTTGHAFEARIGGALQHVKLSADTALDPWLWEEMHFLVDACAFPSADAAADALAAYVLAPPVSDVTRPVVDGIELTVEAGTSRAVVKRSASGRALAVEDKPFGHVDVVHEGQGHGIYRLRVKPGGTIPVHVHRTMQEHELALSSGLTLQDAPVERGNAVQWPLGLPHRYDNPTTEERTILCVDCPRFDPSDEVEVEARALPAPRFVRYVPGATR